METAQRKLTARQLRAGYSVTDICRSLNVSRSYVFKVKKLVEQDQDLTVVRKGGPKKKMRTSRKVAAVAADIARNPRKSIRRLAIDHKMGKTTMSRLVQQDLNMKSRVVQSRPILTDSAKEKRRKRASQLLNRIKKEDSSKVRIFSDEKLFTVDATTNRRNSRYLSDLPVDKVDPEIRITPFSKAPLKTMVLGVVGSDGKKCPIIFVADGERLDANGYQGLLHQHVLPWISRTYPDGNYVFQQDGAPAHTAYSTQQFLKENMSSYWPAAKWPPYLPDLNPLDYSFWGVLQDKVQARAHDSLDDLKQTITKEWRRLSSKYIRRTCGAFRRRLEQVVAANGSYIE